MERQAQNDLRIEEVLTEVGMANVAPKYPFELSGGEQQRVAIARALLPIHPVSLLPMNPPETSTRKLALKSWRSFANYTKKA